MIAWGQPLAAVRASAARLLRPTAPILRELRSQHCGAKLRRTAEGGCPHAAFPNRKKHSHLLRSPGLRKFAPPDSRGRLSPRSLPKSQETFPLIAQPRIAELRSAGQPRVAVPTQPYQIARNIPTYCAAPNCGASLRRTAEGGCPHAALPNRKKHSHLLRSPELRSFAPPDSRGRGCPHADLSFAHYCVTEFPEAPQLEANLQGSFDSAWASRERKPVLRSR